MSKAQERARQYLGIHATEREAGLYELGYEQAEKDVIEKASEWLKEHCWCDFEGARVSVNIDKFRKAMEE